MTVEVLLNFTELRQIAGIYERMDAVRDEILYLQHPEKRYGAPLLSEVLRNVEQAGYDLIRTELAETVKNYLESLLLELNENLKHYTIQIKDVIRDD